MNRLTLNTTIDADHLARAEAALQVLVLERIIARLDSFDRFIAVGYAAIKPLALFGLLVVGAILAFERTLSYSIAIAIGAGAFFTLMLALAWHPGKLAAHMRAWRERSFARTARRFARRMLRQARKQAPFDAEYDWCGDLVSYHRTRDERSSQVWSRRLAGCYLATAQLTVFFKTERAVFPHAIVLHDGSGGHALGVHLDGLDAHRMKTGPARASDGD